LGHRHVIYLTADSNAQETLQPYPPAILHTFLDSLVVGGWQTGLIFVYNTKNDRLISKLDNGLRTGQTFLNDTAFAPDGSASVTDSVNVLYRVAPTGTGRFWVTEIRDSDDDSPGVHF